MEAPEDELFEGAYTTFLPSFAAIG